MKPKDVGSDTKENSNSFRPFRSAATEAQPKTVQTKASHEGVSKKDLFLMSFLGFITGGILILALLFFTGAITGNVVLDLPGEKEVLTEELATPVVETPVENATELVTEVVEEVIVEEPVIEEVVEEEVIEESDPCGPENEITLALDESYDHNGREVILKLAGEFAAQISVGGKKELISVGETMDINGESITMTDGSETEQTATIYIAC